MGIGYTYWQCQRYVTIKSKDSKLTDLNDFSLNIVDLIPGPIEITLPPISSLTKAIIGRFPLHNLVDIPLLIWSLMASPNLKSLYLSVCLPPRTAYQSDLPPEERRTERPWVTTAEILAYKESWKEISAAVISGMSDREQFVIKIEFYLETTEEIEENREVIVRRVERWMKECIMHKRIAVSMSFLPRRNYFRVYGLRGLVEPR